MPFSVRERRDGKYEVVTTAGPHKGHVHGVHPTREKAAAQLRALYSATGGK